MNINWLTLSEAERQLTPVLYNHLADNGSLTRRVRLACSGQFEVKLINHETVQANDQECALLGLSSAAQALSRQVFLCCNQKPLIFARTIIGLVEKNRSLTDRIEKLGGISTGHLQKLSRQLPLIDHFEIAVNTVEPFQCLKSHIHV